ncbi:hypothetical protein XBJ1_2135 [Xenorhabdus bovienii SS-2004]|uniref:Uncharacterized protein n=1 Tax=Xenorhabdus bovienii (strain SS-2004) TaxID=406818 RepID=D3V3E6_XENBS|nr:hypothetical protein XBJ1_2135 [Xenorhabdus bovienii SS-2004]
MVCQLSPVRCGNCRQGNKKALVGGKQAALGIFGKTLYHSKTLMARHKWRFLTQWR